MIGDLQEKLKEWLAQNRALLWAVMSHKDMADATLRGAGVSPEELLQATNKIEDSLDGLKDMMKRLYILLYEIEEEAKSMLSQASEPKRPPAMTVRKETYAEKPSPQPPAIPKEKSRPAPSAGVEPQPEPAPEEAETQPQPVSVNTPKQHTDLIPPNITPPTLEVPVQRKDLSEETSANLKCPVLEKLEEEEKRKVDTKQITIKKPQKAGGLIEYMGLWDWFWRLSEEQQKEVVSIMTDGVKLSQYDLFEREIKVLKPSFASYCWQTANRLMHKNYDELATGLLIKGLTVVDRKHDKEMLHIMYAKYFYRRRHTLPNAYEACINHCEKAIRSYEQDKETRPKPVAPFKLLTMIYEERRDYRELLRVCDRAITVYEGTPEVEGFSKIKDILARRIESD